MKTTSDTEADRAEARTRFGSTIGLYLTDCYASRADIRVEGLAKRVGICRQQLNKQLKKAFGMVAREVLRERQLEYVAHLLVTTTLEIPEIALASGFGHRATLSRVFLAKYGVTPKQYRVTEMRRRKGLL
jgi:AraC-like DNA-binding protein